MRKRSCRNRRLSILLITLCLGLLINCMIWMSLEPSKTSLPWERENDVRLLPKTGTSHARSVNMRSKENVSRKVLQFKNTNEEKLHLYEELLSVPWRSDPDALRKLREELTVDSRARPDMVIATQANTAVGRGVKFYSSYKCPAEKDPKAFNMTEQIYRALPKESPFGTKRFRKCSLVGNSGILLGSGCGKQIDDADFVFRFNAAPLWPHKQDAGMKSNLTTFNPSIFSRRFKCLVNDSHTQSFLNATKEYRGFLWFSCLATCLHADFCLGQFLRYNNTENQFVNGHPDNLVAFKQFWKKRQLPSSGFYFVNVALTQCDEIHLYGFWPFKSVFRGNHTQEVHYHYYDRVRSDAFHGMDQEFALIFQLHRLGVLRLHIQPCL